jgi:hypothetical protein
MKQLTTVLIAGVLAATGWSYFQDAAPGLTSIETGYTISTVRTAMDRGTSYIVANSYEGTVMGISFQGAIKWKNALSGFMNRDLWAEDITGNGSDEILAANADGSVYCLNAKGELQWRFKKNDAPMNAVCVVHRGGAAYVVCGSYDNSIYYLSPKGQLVKEIPSKTYSQEKPWGNDPHKAAPKGNLHVANFLRKLRQQDGSEVLVVDGANNSMSGKGTIYLFNPLEDRPFKTISIVKGSVGSLIVRDIDGSGKPQILLGASSMIQEAGFVRVDPADGRQTEFKIAGLRNKLDGNGYRVVQPEIVAGDAGNRYFVLFGSRILLVPLDLNASKTEVLASRYAFNDMWKDAASGKIILASSQSGGSCVHILDLKNPNWKKAYENLAPPGKIARILTNTNLVRNSLPAFRRPAWEREPLPVYLMSETIPKSQEERVNKIKSLGKSPIFLTSYFMGKAENFDRAGIRNEKYRDRRDRRKDYSMTQAQALAAILPKYEGSPGISFWGGHGNDPYMFSLDTLKKVIDGAKGKKTVLIYPELEDSSDDFAYVMNEHIYPLAKYAQGKNANIYVRTKHTFWQSSVYLPAWQPLLSGEFADVFVPSMEETTDKSMELSLAARLGVWGSGAVDSWGSRCARDNASFDRLRQNSHQMLPNHFLRMMVYHVSSGAQYLDNYPVDQEYMSLLWELIARGALYVPKRSEIVSFSPVHLSMNKPDERYQEEGSNVKWITRYNEQEEKDNPMVFSHLNGSWPGAPVTQWDFSRYAAGVKERRLNFLPPYENGLVLIAPRGRLADHLHPLYRKIIKEYYTDGRQYFSADGKQKYAANEYYKTIESDIKNSARLLPLTVSGNVAWVAAQTSPTHLRLTLIDSGYINPKESTAVVSFHSVSPLKMTDILDRQNFDLANPAAVKIDVPCGMFRFIDIELKAALQ